METIIEQLSDIYKPITEKDIKLAKNYVALRERTAKSLSSRIDELLQEAAEQITRICYKYNVDPKTFILSPEYNEKMFEEVAKVLDELEDEIFDLTLEYSTDCTSDEKHRSSLLAWIITLGRNNRNLRQTLENRLCVFSRDIEALVASMRYAKRNVTQAVSRIKTNLHTVYVTPEVLAAIKNRSNIKATYIKSGGIKHGNIGNSNSEANNIERFGEITVQMAWMKNKQEEYKEEGVDGFYVMRGSNYPCAICDDHVGFHKIEETEHFPPFHGHCCCIAVPLSLTDKAKEKQEAKKKEELKEERLRLRNSDEMPTSTEVVNYDNLESNELLETKKSLRRFLSHCYTMEEIEAAKYIWNHPEELRFERVSPLGEGKDMDNPEDAKNIQNKKDRGIVSYYEYSFDYNGKKWLLKTERHKNGFEMFYTFTK